LLLHFVFHAVTFADLCSDENFAPDNRREDASASVHSSFPGMHLTAVGSLRRFDSANSDECHFAISHSDLPVTIVIATSGWRVRARSHQFPLGYLRFVCTEARQ